MKQFEGISGGESKESREHAIERVGGQIVTRGFEFHATKHDKGGEDPKTYHPSEHLRTLEGRSERLEKILNLSGVSKTLTRMAIAWHDSVIEYDKPKEENITGRIRRHRGARPGDIPPDKKEEGNEAQSFYQLLLEVQKENQAAGREIFSSEDIDKLKFAIEVTYPGVDLGHAGDYSGLNFRDYGDHADYELVTNQNPNLKTLIEELAQKGITKGPLFFQPHLEKALEKEEKVPREALIVALADLGTAGMGSKDEFAKDGDKEAQEVYYNLRRPEIMTRLLAGSESQDKEDRAKVALELIGWLRDQTGFAVFQAMRFERIIFMLKRNKDLSLEEEAGLRQEFSHFEQNIRGAYDRYVQVKAEYENGSKENEKDALRKLLKELNYEV